MHDIEPYHKWLHLYDPNEDELSPFFDAESSRDYTNPDTVYNYYINPLWDSFGSRTLYLKVLFADYDLNCAIIEFIGEWNDAIENDIMQLKRSVIDQMIVDGIYKFILIADNVLNFHSIDDSYYEEWNDDIKDEGGWIVFINLPEHCKQEINSAHLDRYIHLLSYEEWRTILPQHLFQKLDNEMLRLLS